MTVKPFLFQSPRFFVTYSYNHGHGLLLFRSRKSDQHPTRLDVLFQDVRAVELRFWTEGLFIEEMDPKFIESRASKPLGLMERGNKVYAISGADWSGFIVGGIMLAHEDDKEFSDPSALLAEHN